MTQQPARCPRCADTRHVVIEHVIQGGKSYRSCHCTDCDHLWQVAETGEHAPDGSPDKTDKPDRSRPR